MDSTDNIHSFIKSLNYWQTINLFTVLQVGQGHISFKDAKDKAVYYFSDTKKLEFLLEQALNSPDPKL